MPSGANSPGATANWLPLWVADVARLARLRFLVSGPLALCIGALCVGVDVNTDLIARCLMFVWPTHLSTHFVNDYCDLEADKQNSAESGWTGGSRALIDGRLPVWVALALACISSAGAAAWAVLALPRAALLPAALLLFVGWLYSLPPFRLSYRGMGELAVTSVFTLLLPWLVATVAPGAAPSAALSPNRLLPLLPLGLQLFARMLVMNAADAKSDARVGKRTLVVRLGAHRTALLYAACVTLSNVMAGLLAAAAMLPWQVALLLPVLTGGRTARLALELYRQADNTACCAADERAGAALPGSAMHASLVAMLSYVVGYAAHRYGVPAAVIAPVLLAAGARGAF